MKLVQFAIPFRVIPYCRLRRSKSGGVYLPPELMENIAAIRRHAELAWASPNQISRPVCVYAAFTFPSAQHGDLDNLLKTVLDALQPPRAAYRNAPRVGGIIADDRFVHELHGRLCLKAGPDGAVVLISTLEAA